MKTELPERKPNRLLEYDYSETGAYFITVCTKNREPLLSRVVAGEKLDTPCTVVLTSIGIAVDGAIRDITEHYRGVHAAKYVIMPNHIHMLLYIQKRNDSSVSVSRIIKEFKTRVTKQIGAPIWQKSFYDHIIRNQEDYDMRYRYIENNPANWLLCRDEYYL